MSRILAGIGIGLLVLIILALAVWGRSGLAPGRGSSSELKAINDLIKEGRLDEARKKIDEITEKNMNDKRLGEAYFNLAKVYEDKKEIVKARDIYQTIIKKHQNIENILEVQEKLGSLNTVILFSREITEKDILYEVEPGDTLMAIAKKFNTTIDLIKKSNALKGDTIRARSKIKISKAQYKILIDKSQNILTLMSSDDIVKVYRASTGENNCTPTGVFKVLTKIADPVWFTENAIVPAESPDNILGSRWLGLSIKGYGIHGTPNPETIGSQATKGCIRMSNRDVEELYTIVPLGTEVTIVD